MSEAVHRCAEGPQLEPCHLRREDLLEVNRERPQALGRCAADVHQLGEVRVQLCAAVHKHCFVLKSCLADALLGRRVEEDPPIPVGRAGARRWGASWDTISCSSSPGRREHMKARVIATACHFALAAQAAHHRHETRPRHGEALPSKHEAAHPRSARLDRTSAKGPCFDTSGIAYMIAAATFSPCWLL